MRSRRLKAAGWPEGKCGEEHSRLREDKGLKLEEGDGEGERN